MLESIRRKLDEIEETEQVKILHCVESGSRAWGFPSPDSDYDVRFIYVRQPEAYLRLEGIRDVIEWQLDDVYDINGWDVQKYLRLLYKSNPTVFEWKNSPVIYRTSPEWEQVAAVTDQYFHPRHLLYHYLSMARSNAHAYLRGEEVSLKKYFYVLRPLLACRWIMDRGTPPPIEFDRLTEAELPVSLYETVEQLLAQKRSTPEMGKGAHIPVLDSFIHAEFDELDNAAELLPGKPDRSWEPLNGVFRQLLDR